MTSQIDLFGGETPTMLVGQELLALVEREERSAGRALRADEAGAIQHGHEGRHDPDTRCLRCTLDGRQVLERLAQHRAPTLPPSSVASALPDRARARKADPETSRDAAASVGSLTARQTAILRLLHQHGPMSDERLCREYRASDFSFGLPQTDSSIRSRRAELVDTGLARDSGRRVQTATGRKSAVWTITYDGIAFLRGAAA